MQVEWRARAAVFGVGIVVACAWLACGEATSPVAEVEEGLARVEVGMHVIHAEVVDTPELQAKGLSDRARLAEGRGMIFPYPQPRRPGFWMKDMRFDIDIVWIAGGRVSQIHHDIPREPWDAVYRPDRPIDLVLEVPAGTSRRLGWQAGDPVQITPDPRTGSR